MTNEAAPVEAPETALVTFLPGGERTLVAPGTTLAEAAQAAGVPLALPCGGKGTCGKCQVVVQDGQMEQPTAAELEHLSAVERSRHVRLACQCRLQGDALVQVPPTSRVVGQKAFDQVQRREVDLDPNVRRTQVELSPPSLADQRSDFRRLREALGEEACPGLTAFPDALRELPGALRADQYRVGVTTVGCRLADVHPAHATPPCLGLAVDIGTSTVVAYLLDLETGQALSTAAEHNPQIRHGADVISRVEYANSQPDGLLTLREEVVQIVNHLAQAALEQVGASARCIYEAVVVGNTCMHHLFLGLDPRRLAEAPYVPVSGEPMDARPTEIGLEMNPRGNVHLLPCIAGFVGADTVGVIVAEAMTRRPYPVLAVDIGTNGEVALWSGERLLVASCAAGPAFEGSHIERGMRAGPGAIDHVALNNGDLSFTTIGGEAPVGLCGSGLFDAMAVALEADAVEASGRMADDQVAQSLPPALRVRLTGEGNDRRFVLAPADGHSLGGVFLSQRDVRQIQLAKAAVRATVEMMLERVGLDVADLHEVLLAGAFGNYIRPASAVRIGLLPPLPVEQIRGVGNAAGTGALLALLSCPERAYAAQVARQAEHVELFRARGFQDRFAENMLF